MSYLSDTQRSRCFELLNAGLSTLSVALTPQQLEALMNYLDLLCYWNRAYNLSAIRDPEDMVFKHLLDSLAIQPYVHIKSGEKWADVGTGAGLPGIPLAICFPERHWTLVDSNGKKTRFLHQVKQALTLDNVAIHQTRVEVLDQAQSFDGVISRAFTSVSLFIERCQHMLNSDGALFAMKGVYPHDELATLSEPSKVSQPFELVESYSISVPGVEGERCLLRLAASATPVSPYSLLSS